MRIASIVTDSIVDGPGFRVAIFTQGCVHNCFGCHNPGTHDPSGGYEESVESILEKIKQNHLIDGITLTGGDPFEQAEDCARLAKQVKLLNSNYTVWTYTGYTYEQILERNNSAWNHLIDATDVLVDGPFILSQKSYELKFRGSKNQRLIDVRSSRLQDKIVLYTVDDNILEKFKVPES